MTGLDLPTTLVFDYPSAEAITEAMVSMLPPEEAAAAKPSKPAKARRADVVDSAAELEPSRAITAPDFDGECFSFPWHLLVAGLELAGVMQVQMRSHPRQHIPACDGHRRSTPTRRC